MRRSSSNINVIPNTHKRVFQNQHDKLETSISNSLKKSNHLKTEKMYKSVNSAMGGLLAYEYGPNYRNEVRIFFD